jgi:starch synthase (maltosyl-transferring)
VLQPDLLALAQRHASRTGRIRTVPDLRVTVEPERARFGSWYEIFPRSVSADCNTHGTLATLCDRLDYIAGMGFDVLYLPPVHPIGRTFRKGRNNKVTAAESEVGSPWAIGAAEGGHKALHPSLGSIDDFRKLVTAARDRGMEIALDMAFQASPDHPYVKANPEWFLRRPDGSIQYSENPPKKYQDIYPFHFESDEWVPLWAELKSIFSFWIGHGVRIFRVDNPHTKPFRFWEWLIAEIKKDYPDVLFLAEAFTRPKVMYRLAKLGFSQSYTYFSWKDSKQEIIDYFSELTASPVREFFRPNCWPNTPDILPASLRGQGAPAFRLRLALAATLSATYGIYGPAYELLENSPRDVDSDEYLNSEKYELKHWNIDSKTSIAPFIAKINQIRRNNRALQSNESLLFHETDNPMILCYSKSAGDNVIVVLLNLDATYVQSGWAMLNREALRIDEHFCQNTDHFEVHDLLADVSYQWRKERNFVRLDPAANPAHVFELRQAAPTTSVRYP